jgi:hypothetical protein
MAEGRGFQFSNAMMMFRSVSVSCLLWLGMADAGAAVAMVVVPDGVGGTRYTFEEVSANPLVPVSVVLSSGFRMELPPGMFVPQGPGSGGASDIVGVFPAIARVREVGGGSEYDVVSLLIGADGGYASFGFDRAFVPGPGQTMARLTLVPSGPGALGIAPEALVPGTHVVSSVLFGSVTVTVVPEPGSAGLLAVAVLMALRRRGGGGVVVAG